MNRCACIVLAAGGSTRLGSPKQLLRADGETLLHRTTRLALEAQLQPVCVVLGSNAEEHSRAIEDLGVEIVLNAEWQSGMSASMRAGIAQMIVRPDVDRVLILVCDQLGVTVSLIRDLLVLSQREPEKIVAAFYRERTGVPCIFPRRSFEQLMKVRGDNGARPLLQEYAAELLTLPFLDGELDIDTQEDVTRAGLKSHS